MPASSSSGIVHEVSTPRQSPGFCHLPRMLPPRQIQTRVSLILSQLPARQIYDVQTFWLLAGIAVRLGMRLTGQNDSESSSDSVYNSQLRRRLWRQIVWIDGRSHQHIGLKPPLHEVRFFPLPANLNDADINPNMTELPLIHKGPTEMTCEFSRFGFVLSINKHCPRSLILRCRSLLVSIRGWRVYDTARQAAS